MSTIKPSADNANELHKKLIEGENFNLPEIDWKDPVFNIDDILNDPNFKKPLTLTNEDLTQRKVGGDGTMDYLMKSTHVHLREEYDKGRITGNEYTKAYIALTEVSVGNAVQYLINRDQSYWQAITAKINAQASMVDLEIAKNELALKRYQVKSEEAKFANTKMNTLNLESAYNNSEYSLANILPAQFTLIKEQGEVQRAQTLDERSDKLIVKGSVGKQKDLYSQQIEAYKRDAEYKVAKFYVDAFTVMKTIDEGLAPPDVFVGENITKIVEDVKTKVGL